MKRITGVWAGLAPLLVLAGVILGLWEWMQRRRFDRLSEELAEVAAEVQATSTLGVDADGSVGLTGKPGGRYGSSHGSSHGGTALTGSRMADWGCFGLSLDEKNRDMELWGKATFDLQLSQERNLILGSPEVRFTSKVKLHPTIVNAVESRLKARGISYRVEFD